MFSPAHLKGSPSLVKPHTVQEIKPKGFREPKVEGSDKYNYKHYSKDGKLITRPRSIRQHIENFFNRKKMAPEVRYDPNITS